MAPATVVALHADARREALEDATIHRALNILVRRMREPGINFGTPAMVKDYLRLHIAGLEHEVFEVLLLDVKNCLIVREVLFRGTLTHQQVHPREVVKLALRHNAATVMVAHNHPSGSSEPSAADLHLTRALRQALELVEIRLLDHFIATPSACYSMAEHGDL